MSFPGGILFHVHSILHAAECLKTKVSLRLTIIPNSTAFSTLAPQFFLKYDSKTAWNKAFTRYLDGHPSTLIKIVSTLLNFSDLTRNFSVKLIDYSKFFIMSTEFDKNISD